MQLPFYIAKRYLFSKKSTNAINIISGVSATGIAFGTMALLIVLSVFNGLEGLVTGLYDTFNPDIKITPKTGKVFTPDSTVLAQIKQLEGLTDVSLVLEEIAVLQHEERTAICRLKGVEPNYLKVAQVDTAIIRGKFDIAQQGAVLGLGIEIELGVNVFDDFNTMSVYMPKRTAKATLNPEKAFKKGGLKPVGTFSIQESFDKEFVFVPLAFLQQLMDYKQEVSHIEIALNNEENLADIQQQITQIMGSNFEVKNRFEQNEFLYKVMQSEKWAVYFILSLILMVASFNIVGSLSMLVVEKKKDIGILKSMGATKQLVRSIFLTEGVLLALLGGIIGMLLAFFICLAQQVFGIVKIGGQNLLIDTYPVQMNPLDFLLVFITVSIIALLASWWPAKKAASQM